MSGFFEKQYSADEMSKLVLKHFKVKLPLLVTRRIRQEKYNNGITKLFYLTGEVCWYQEARITDYSEREYTFPMMLDQGLPEGKPLDIVMQKLSAIQHPSQYQSRPARASPP